MGDLEPAVTAGERRGVRRAPPPPPSPGPGRSAARSGATTTDGAADRRPTTSGRSPGPARWSSRACARRRSSTSPRSAAPRGADPRRRGDVAGHRPAGRPLRHRPRRRCRRRGPPTRRAGWPQLVDIDAAAYVKRVEAAGDKAFVEAIVYPHRTTCRASVARGYDGHPRRARHPRRAPAGADRSSPLPILGTVGEVTAEMIEEHPDTLPGRRPGRALRPAGAVRRPAAGHVDGAVVNAVGAGRRGARALPGRRPAGRAAAS